MHRREVLGALGTALGLGPGLATSTNQATEGTCHDDDHDREYPCHNHDENAPGLDSYYIKTWTGDAEYEVEEDHSDDLFPRYRWYSYYGDPAIEGIVENISDRDIPNVYVEVAHYADDEETVVATGYEEMGTLKAGLEYEFDFYVSTNYAGDYSLFELWVRQE